jgi:hypothetical protein
LMRHSRLVILAAAVALLVSCSGPKTPDAAALEASASAHILSIPQAAPEKYHSPDARKAWRNPYLIIREDGVALLDPDDHLERILKPEELTRTLGDLPVSAWPYGRVVAVTENGVKGSADDEARIRKNRAVVAGTLESLHVVINWIPSA